MGVSDHQDLGEREGKDLALAVGTGAGGAMGSKFGQGGKGKKDANPETDGDGDGDGGSGGNNPPGGKTTKGGEGEADPSAMGRATVDN